MVISYWPLSTHYGYFILQYTCQSMRYLQHWPMRRTARSHITKLPGSLNWVKFKQFKNKAYLAYQFLSWLVVFQALVICPDNELLLSPPQPMPSLLPSHLDSQPPPRYQCCSSSQQGIECRRWRRKVGTCCWENCAHSNYKCIHL